MTEHVSAGEWERWREDDREWKKQAMGLLHDHTVQLAELKGREQRTEVAAASAESAKRASLISNVIGVVLNGLLIGLGLRAGG
jgi:hypothetical protein